MLHPRQSTLPAPRVPLFDTETIHHTEQLPTASNSVARNPTRFLANSSTPNGLLGGARVDDTHCWEWWLV